MAASIIVQPGQQLPDIALQHCGALEAMADVALLNSLSLTADLVAGAVLTVPDAMDKRVVKYLADGGPVPATGELVTIGEGIGYWAIEIDFILS